MFTSVAIVDGTQAGLHVDKDNCEKYHNWVHKLSSFSGGEICVKGLPP